MKLKQRFLAAIMVVSLHSFAQNSALKIGQQLPDLEINKILYYTTKKAKLSDFKGKLIILDFWGPSCSYCIDGMPKMDSLQKHFGEKIAILPIHPVIPTEYFTKEFVNYIDSFWHARPKLFKTSLPSIVDNNFAQHFPQRVMYQVWIDGNRVVRAITHQEYVNKQEIQKMLDGIYPQWESEIKENSPDKSVHEYLSRLEFAGLKDQNYSFFTPYLKGIDSYMDIDTSSSKILVSYKNLNILSFYRKYLLTNGLSPTNILLETKDSVRYFTKGYRNEWLRDNSYCYELKINRKVDEKELADYIRQDADKYFGLNTKIENRNINCLVFKKLKSRVSAIKADYKYKISVQEFYTQLRYEQDMAWQSGKKAIPVLNDTNPKSTLELKYPGTLKLTDIKAVRKVLQSQGYDLVEEKRLLKMFVISEIN